MPEPVGKQVQRIDARVRAIQEKYKRLRAYFERDGNIDPREKRRLLALRDKITLLRKRRDALNAERGRVDFADDEGQKHKGEMLPFDHATFETAFMQSVRNWTTGSRISLNALKAYMEKQPEPSGIAVASILVAISGFFAQARVGVTAYHLFNGARSLLESGLNAARGPTPSLKEIHRSWHKFLAGFNADSKKAFRKFIDEYKRKEGIPAGSNTVAKEHFLVACREFGTTHLPDEATIEKWFMKEALRTVKDGADWDGGRAGFADIEMIAASDVFLFDHGQIDDAPQEMLDAVRTVFKGKRVIDLPAQIRVTLRKRKGGHKDAVIERASYQPGSTGFALTSGDRELFDTFMKKKAYRLAKVDDLKLEV